MTLKQIIITVLIMTAVTILTRGIVFIVFRNADEAPESIKYLGKVLPPAAIAMLVVYALRGVNFTSGSRGLPEVIAVLLTVLAQKYTRQSLISIAVGTIGYMLLVQFVF